MMTASFDFPILERKINHDSITILTETLSKTETGKYHSHLVGKKSHSFD